MEIFKDHNDKITALLEKEFAIGTIKKYRTTYKHLNHFISNQYGLRDIELKKLDHAFITGFEFYLRKEHGCATNSALKHIKNLKKIISQCIANEWIDRNPFQNYKTKTVLIDREFLSLEEVSLIYQKAIPNSTLAQVRDVFIFSCYTGLSYIDLQMLSKANVVNGIDGEKWIFTHRKKTDAKTNIPLLPIPLEIINKYSNYPINSASGKLLPMISNQKTNAYLKALAIACNINKNLTFHMARHTFATSITLTNNVPLETVSKMLGHRSIKTTQHYAKILDKKVSYDMGILRDKFNSNQERTNEKINNDQ